MKDSKSIQWIKARSKTQNFKMGVLIASNVIFAVLSVAFAFAIKLIINGAMNPDREIGKNNIIWGAIALVGILIIQFLFRLIINGLTEHIKAKLEVIYKSYIFDQILGKKYSEVTKYHSGELVNRLTNDVSVVADGVTGIVPTLVAAIVRLVCAVGALIYLDWIFAIAFTVAGLLVFTVIGLLRGKLKGLHKKTQETDGKVRSFMQECIENLLAIKVFSANDKIEKKSDSLQEDNFKVKMKRKNYAVTGHATYNFIFSAGYVFALVYGGIKIFTGTLFYDDLSAILQLVNNVQVPFASLSGVVPKYYAMLASSERLMELEQIAGEPHKESIDRESTYKNLKSINFDKVDFSYGRDNVFTDSSFNIKKGEFVAVKGSSGIGKSTLVKLLLGVYDIDKGEIFLDTNEGKIILDSSTRPLFSYVPQGNMLFSGTIKDNLTLTVGEVSEEEIDNALKLSCANTFISELPDGINTYVGENGLGLSEGQIQRIAIARAILAGAPCLLLDEATSALDEITEKEVLSNLKTLKDKTLIIISHKKAAFEICDVKISIKNKRIFCEV